MVDTLLGAFSGGMILRTERSYATCARIRLWQIWSRWLSWMITAITSVRAAWSILNVLSGVGCDRKEGSLGFLGLPFFRC